MKPRFFYKNIAYIRVSKITQGTRGNGAIIYALLSKTTITSSVNGRTLSVVNDADLD